MPVYLVGDGKRVMWSNQQPCCWFGESKHTAFDLIDEIFEKLNSISSTFHEPGDLF